MTKKWIAVWIIIIGIAFLFLPQVIPSHAQEPVPENDANCVACHEHQYYVYDSGKWFCLCEAPMHCVYCHGGRTDSMVKEIAHEGLVLYPTRNHSERCQTCHTEDYMSRVVTFEKVAGVSSAPLSIITATPVGTGAEPVEAQPPALLSHLTQREPWRLVGLGVLALALVAIVIFGYRCWKADCLAKNPFIK
jgi:hypothetical protein